MDDKGVSEFRPIDDLYQKNFEWEEMDYKFWGDWITNHWNLAIYAIVIYVITIHSGKMWMRNREPFKMKFLLIVWNVGLAVLSIVGFLRCFPELLMTLSGKDGFHRSVCSWDQRTMTIIFWEFVMTWSKYVELGDTIFIVLRKQPLIFLHWYHHATVLLYSWTFQPSHDPSHTWFMVMNYGVHSIMYSYYALRASGFRVPRQVSISITSLQILQMIAGIVVSVYAANSKRLGQSCQKPTGNIVASLLMYTSYCILFMNFFYGSYVGQASKKKVKSN